MKRTSRHLLIACLVVAFSSACSSTQTSDHLCKTPEEIAALLPEFMSGLSSREDWSGVVLLASEGRILFHKAYGLANRSYEIRNNTETKFNTGSMYKMFTAVAIARLVEREAFSFDDAIGDYLDSSWVSEEIGQKVRIKHLLSHTSGFGDFFTPEFYATTPLKFKKIDDYKSFVYSSELLFEPGSNYEYSNSGYILLGAIIEKVSGKCYAEFVREEIFIPAGMVNTGCYRLDVPQPNIAVGYYQDEGDLLKNNTFLHPVNGSSAGGGYSTTADLIRFEAALKSGTLVSEETLEMLWTNKENAPKYGYGFDVRHDWGHIGHAGGFRGVAACFYMYEENNYTLVVLSNYGHFSPVLHAVWRWANGRE